MKRSLPALLVAGAALIGTSLAPMSSLAAPSPLPPPPPLPLTPASCDRFAAKYFDSGLRAGRVHYTLASHTTHIGTSIGVVGYSEGTFVLTPSLLDGLLEGEGKEWFSDRRYTSTVSPASQPFDAGATDVLSINLEKVSRGPALPPELAGEFILDSWGFVHQTFNIQGCIDDNIVYGTVNTSNGDSLVSIALDNLVAP